MYSMWAIYILIWVKYQNYYTLWEFFSRIIFLWRWIRLKLIGSECRYIRQIEYSTKRKKKLKWKKRVIAERKWRRVHLHCADDFLIGITLINSKVSHYSSLHLIAPESLPRYVEINFKTKIDLLEFIANHWLWMQNCICCIPYSTCYKTRILNQ